MPSLRRDTNGNVALMTALLSPVLLGFASGAVDFYHWSNEKARLKQLSETLATRGAREFLLANATEPQVEAVVDSVLDTGFSQGYGFSSVNHDVQADANKGEVTVGLTSQPARMLILGHFQPFDKELNVTSTAVALGGMNVCVIALESDERGAVSAKSKAQLNAEECSLISNSKSTQGVVSLGLSGIEAGMICSAGGALGGPRNFSPMPTLDCPVYDDPLAKREPPAVGPCDEFDAGYGERLDEVVTAAANAAVTELTRTADRVTGGLAGGLTEGVTDSLLGYETYHLSPGVYCGGVTVGAFADVRLAPGTYVIKDGAFNADLGARITGENVSFYLVGDDATFYFGPEAKIDLQAEKQGPLAGILFFEDRHAPADRVHRILSDDARMLLGTFYLPRGTLSVASLLPVADKSAYTAIVAKRLRMNGSPTLVLNADYNNTDIPVPTGVGPVGGATYLRE